MPPKELSPLSWMCLNQTAHTPMGIRQGAFTLGGNGLGNLPNPFQVQDSSKNLSQPRLSPFTLSPQRNPTRFSMEEMQERWFPLPLTTHFLRSSPDMPIFLVPILLCFLGWSSPSVLPWKCSISFLLGQAMQLHLQPRLPHPGQP